MILHLIPLEKFTVDYVKKIFELFDQKQHKFLVYGEEKKEYRLEEIKDEDMVEFIPTLATMGQLFAELVSKSKIIVCHSLFLKTIDLYILNRTSKKYNRKTCWVIWGKDLYEDYEKSQGVTAYLLVKPVIKEYLRRSLIENMHTFVTAGDYEALVERYDIKPNSIVCSAQYTYTLLPIIHNPQNDKIQVMVGHSATETCRHIETFQKLKKYTGKVRIFCPLSYPRDEEYIQKVIAEGRKLFGNDFVPMTDFMQYNEYVRFLNTIDIGVFNNSRQQGMGNITNLLYLGKKVYLSNDNTIRKSYCGPQYTIFNCAEIEDESFLIPLKETEAEQNKNNIIYKFSNENFRTEWGQVFESYRFN
jgi:dTDP-N-acetylfucosamine:lipid II N-acetylfucosaminyltransferase